jgi:transcriptional regulator with XRE-family HTH domain
MSFGKFILSQRTRRGLQLKAVALSIGITSAYLSKIERGANKLPSDDLLIKLAELFQLEADDMFVAANRFPIDMRNNIREVVAVYRAYQKKSPQQN